MKKKLSFGPWFSRPLTTSKVEITAGEQLPSPNEYPGDIARQLRIQALSAEHTRLANSNRPGDLARCKEILDELHRLTNRN